MYLFLVFPLDLIFVHVCIIIKKTKRNLLIDSGKLNNELCFTLGCLFIVNTGLLIIYTFISTSTDVLLWTFLDSDPGKIFYHFSVSSIQPEKMSYKTERT